MKRFLPLFLVIAMALTQACEGPEGPQGPAGPQGTPGTPGAQGPQGPPGETAADSAQVLNFQVDFTLADSAEIYSAVLPFTGEGSPNMQVSDSDVVLVYALEGTTENPTDPDNPILFWSPLPRRIDFTQGPITYNYAYSMVGIYLFIETQLDLANAPGITNDQVFRTVVIPGKNIGGRTTGKPLSKADLSKYPVDLNDYNAVIKYFKINDKNVKTFTIK